MRQIALLFLILWVSVQAGTFQEASLAELGMKFYRVDACIPTLQRNYTFLWISDLHIIDANDMSEVKEEDMTLVKQRLEKAFVNPTTKLTAQETWQRLPEALNASGADGVFFGGDLVDFGSLANIRAAKDGLQRLTIPWLYLRADHDVAPWWCVGRHEEETKVLEASIDGNHDVLFLELEDLLIVGWNLSTTAITADNALRVKGLFSKNKPVVFLTHVPLDSPLDSTLAEKSRASDKSGQRNLTWGPGAYYIATPAVQNVLDAISAEESPVRLILAGHLHFNWEGQFATNARECVFGAASSGQIGVITLHP